MLQEVEMVLRYLRYTLVSNEVAEVCTRWAQGGWGGPEVLEVCWK
jgi:hypothetical protein